MGSSSSINNDNILLSIKFGSIPSKKRFFDWLETKWSPAILRSYDIAGIRVGERPVSTKRINDIQLNIIFQNLDIKAYESNTIGTLNINLDNNDDSSSSCS